MHSFLFIGSDTKLLDEELKNIYKRYAISSFDIQSFKKEKGSIGIEDIRKLQKDIILTPLKSIWKAVTVYDADTMTIDAQNSFLKTLEEPPPHTLMFLIGATKEAFLPTVLSRCFIKEVKAKQKNELVLEKTDEIALLANPDIPLGKRLFLAEKFSKSRETAITWIEYAQLVLRDDILTTQKFDQIAILKKLQKTATMLKTTNAAPRIILEHFFLSL